MCAERTVIGDDDRLCVQKESMCEVSMTMI